ncbi:MAG TPA: F0F1 ATP synthase subunit epsilon [Crocinitomicaceae bacterium]|nr:F0F1 ATP synthase subunit epsilon [Crocinitomicaceae bacterium]
MLLEIITPETKVLSEKASAVQLPGLDGSFQVLNNHAPIISSLTQGEIKVNLETPIEDEESLHATVRTDETNKAVVYVKINGGVIEMSNNKVIILAE